MQTQYFQFEWFVLLTTTVIFISQCIYAVEAIKNDAGNSRSYNNHLHHHQYNSYHHLTHRSSAAASIAASKSASASATPSSIPTVSDSESGSFLGPELRIIGRVLEDCQTKNDFVGCLKQKALTAISRAMQQDSIKIMNGLVLERQNHTEPTGIVDVVADERALNSLDPLDKELLMQTDKLARTHTLKIDLSEGRDKKKKKGGGHIKYIVAALLTAMGIAGPIGLKALAAIAVKALVVSKVALTIAGIIALKKLFSHDHHEETSFQVHAGDHNRRSTYVIRPVSKASGGTLTSAGSNGAGTVDPYRYYYEYH